MTGWELYDTDEDWWIGIAWGVGGYDVVDAFLPIPVAHTEIVFA